MTHIETLTNAQTELAHELARIDAEIATVQAMAPRHEPVTAIGSAMALLHGAEPTPEQSERLTILGNRRHIIASGLKEASAAIQTAMEQQDAEQMRKREPQVIDALSAIEFALDNLIAACDQLAAIRTEAHAKGIDFDRCRLPTSADLPIREWTEQQRRTLNDLHALYQQLTTPPKVATPKKTVIAAAKQLFTGNPQAGELVA